MLKLKKLGQPNRPITFYDLKHPSQIKYKDILMNKYLRPVFFIFTLSTLLLLGSFCIQSQQEFQFKITYSGEASSGPITGRVYVIISKNKEREPRLQTGYTGVPFWGKNIHSLKPDEPAVIDTEVFGYPLENIRDIPPGDYYVQGFINIYTEFKRSDGHVLWLHNDQWEGQQWNRSPGNLYSDVQKIHLNPAETKTIQLTCENVIPPIEVPPDTKWVKRIKIQSKILTEFWGQPIYLGATALLPKGYHEHPDTDYPVNYIQGHFSLRPPYGFRENPPEEENPWIRRGYEFYKFWTSDECPRMLAVTFQHPCPFYDDSYAVNSPNVGPYQDAIMKELIPEIERHFRIIRKPYARILSGGSTGGWISLALQVYQPDFFGGTFSLCPDPVDFRYYQIVNIYKDPNAYFKDFGWLRVERPNIRSADGSIRNMMKDENLYELVRGNKCRSGGQWDIWQAAWGPMGEDGYPKPIWDKKTGAIDHQAAAYWKEHWDIRHYLETNWEEVGPKLKGKLHIYTGDMDSFYLNNAVVLLEKFLESTTDPYYEGVIEYGDGEPHCWGPRGRDLLKLMEKQILKFAPKGEETSSWRY